MALISCANIFGTRGLSLTTGIRLPEYKYSRDVFQNFCRVKRESPVRHLSLKTHRFGRVGISIANDRTEPLFIRPFLLTRSSLLLATIFFLPISKKGSVARSAASSAPVRWHLLLRRKVVTPVHPDKVHCVLHLVLPMSYGGITFPAAQRKMFHP